jgi:hypothetical protein
MLFWQGIAPDEIYGIETGLRRGQRVYIYKKAPALWELK